MLSSACINPLLDGADRSDQILEKERGQGGPSSEMGRFETERLATEANLAVLTDLFPREYGYTDVIEYGPLTAEWVTLLCDDCYDSSEDGMRTAYEAWATDA